MIYTLLLTSMLAVQGERAGEAAAPVVVVECKTDADIRGAEIQLRDLAEVRTPDPELTQRISEVSFGRRPAFGFSRIISRQDILMRLTGEGLRANQLDLTGARQVVLHPVGVRLMPSDILSAADPVLEAVLELENDSDIEFEVLSKLRPVTIPPGRRSMDLSASLRDGTVHHGSAVIDVAVIVDDVEFKTIRVPYKLRRYRQVLVSSVAIRRGMPLSETNLELRRMEASSGTSPYLTNFDSIRDKVAARDINANTKMTHGTITDPAVIFSGDPVNLVATSGRIQVATRAVALGDGAVGARIPVRNLTANKIVQATVRGRGLVVVEATANVRVR